MTFELASANEHGPTTGTTPVEHDLDLPSGFGAADCAVYLSGFGSSTLGSRNTVAALSVGFADGAANQYAAAFRSRNNQGTTSTSRWQATNRCLLRLKPTNGTIRAEAEHKSFPTDKARVDWHTLDTQDKYSTVIPFKLPAAGDSHVGTFDSEAVLNDTHDETAPGFQADVVFVATINSTTSGAKVDDGGISFGVWVRGVGQRALSYFSADGATRDSSRARRSTNRALQWITGVPADDHPGIEISEHANGFSAKTVGEGAAMRIGYLAIKLGTPFWAALGDYDVPTSTGTNTESGLGFPLEWIFSLVSHLDPADDGTDVVATEAGVIGMGFQAGTGTAACQAASSDPAADPTNTNSMASALLHGATVTDGGEEDQWQAVDQITNGTFRVDTTRANVPDAGAGFYFALANRLLMEPDAVALPLSVPAPTLDLGTLTLTPDPVELEMVVPAITHDMGTLTLTPAAVALPLSAPDPVLDLGTLLLAPDAVALPIAVPAITHDMGTKALTPSPVALPLSAPDPVLDLGELLLAPDAIALPIVVPAITHDMGTKALTPDAIAVPMIAPDPVLSLEGLDLVPDAVAIALAVPAITHDMGELALLPDPVAIPGLVPDPVLLVGALTLTPDAIAIPLVLPPPSLKVPRTLTPDPVALALAVPAVTLILGQALAEILFDVDLVDAVLLAADLVDQVDLNPDLVDQVDLAGDLVDGVDLQVDLVDDFLEDPDTP